MENIYTVVVADDEDELRQALCAMLPWEELGFRLVGDAANGLEALELVERLEPDLLITDIQMPFISGIDLARQAREIRPAIHIVFLSGYDDFEYAQQAISLGVERYLLKPITKAAFMTALEEVREKIESEREAQSYAARFHTDSQEYEQFARRSFVEKVVSGELTAQQIYEQAADLGIDLIADGYCLAMFTVLPEDTDRAEAYSDTAALLTDAVLSYFLKNPEYLLLRWNMTAYLVILKGRADAMDDLVQQCIQSVEQACRPFDPAPKWFLAVSTPTDRISRLPESYDRLSRLWACRYLSPERHLLTAQTVGDYLRHPRDQGLDRLDALKCNPSIIMDVLKTAVREELPRFVETFLQSVREGLSSGPFCSYLMLSARFTATEFVTQVLQLPQDALLGQVSRLDMVGKPVSEADLREYLTELLGQAVALRDGVSSRQYRKQLNQAIRYIDEHYAEESLSLNRVAQEVNISPNYLSAVFSQETKCTFVEYVTRQRMKRARELLRDTDLRSGEIAAAVGYRDSHYFSYLFRKTQGCTPRDYRNGGKSHAL